MESENLKRQRARYQELMADELERWVAAEPAQLRLLAPKVDLDLIAYTPEEFERTF